MPLLAALLVLACMAALQSRPAGAAMLIEASEEGRPIRLVVDRSQDRVLLSNGGGRALVDLRGGMIFVEGLDGAARGAHAWFRPGHEATPPYRVEPFGPGPILAGQLSRYHVLFAGEQVCAELMLNGWMRPFLEPAVRALAVLEQIKGARSESENPCAAIPFAAYAAAGWPLMAGKIDHPTFVTTAVRFDYQPAPDELAAPERFEEVGLDELVKLPVLERF
jgi:hypothetical protein